VTLRGPALAVLGVVLLLSLGANLVVAGFAISRMYGPRPGGSIERIVAIGIRAVPPERRNSTTEATPARHDDFKARFDEVQAARRQMFEAMRADPFDPAALQAAYTNLRAKTSELQQIGQQIVADALAAAPAEVRSRIRPPRGPFP
jgi:uncharacterized membrane protein